MWGDRYWYFDVYYLMRNWLRNIHAGQAAGHPGRVVEPPRDAAPERTE